MEAIFWYILGLLVGIAIGKVLLKEKPAGVLRVDRSDVDGPYLFLELSKDVEYITHKSKVVLTVKQEDFIPHK